MELLYRLPNGVTYTKVSNLLNILEKFDVKADHQTSPPYNYIRMDIQNDATVQFILNLGVLIGKTLA